MAHLLQDVVLFFELIHVRHNGYIHATLLSPPFVKS